jgi:hypothetical protein
MQPFVTYEDDFLCLLMGGSIESCLPVQTFLQGYLRWGR